MTYVRSQTIVLSICCLLVAFSTAGCLGGSGVSNSEAKERALAAEEEHITEQFKNASCVESWGLTSFVEKNATVINRTAEGVYVAVTHPFSYTMEVTLNNSMELVVADAGSDARYLVTAADVKRLSGTHVSPC